MKRTYLIIFLLIAGLMCNGCCFLAGMGMENANKRRQERSDAFHAKVGEVMDRVAN